MPGVTKTGTVTLEQKIEDTIQRLADTQAELESLMAGEIDAVLTHQGGALILLRDAQAALAESQARYHRLVTRMSAIVFELEPDGTVLFVNDAVTPITGYTPLELVGHNWWELLCPPAWKEQCEELKPRLRTGDVSDFELTLMSRDKRALKLEVNFANRYSHDGELQAIIGFGIDITERKRAEETLRRREEEFRTMIEAWPDIVARFDATLHYRYISPAVTNITGLPAEAYIDKAIGDADFPGALLDVWQDSIRQVFETGELRTFEYSFAGPNGTFSYENRIVPEFGADGQVRTALAWSRDITERKQAEAQQKLAAAVFDSSNDAVLVSDSAGSIIMANKAFGLISGFTSQEMIGNDLRLLCADPDDTAFDEQMWRDLTQSGHWQGEVRYRRKNGEVYPAWQNIGAVKDERAQVQHYVIVFSDISTIKQTEERMTHLAHHDALTGIPNRLLFTASLDLAVESARRRNKELALLFLDLDRFKFINDTLGHTAGDNLLQTVASRLKDTVRAEDTVARLGGDEFTVILTEITNARDAALIACEILEKIAQPILINDQKVITSASIGISVFPNDASNRSDLIRAADMALYRAKEYGRNNYQFFTRELTDLAQAHHSIEQGLRRALAQHEFVLYYQPLVSLRDGTLAGLEALLRWRHPQRGLLEPAAFLDIAEETGLIEPIGEWVLRTACRQAQRWQAEGLPLLHLSVNISTQQLLRGNLLDTLRKILDECGGLPTGLRLDLEITENMLQLVEQQRELLQQIKALGVMLAIDDFGTGYSSLGRLKQFPIDTIKIDRSFVKDIPRHADDNAIVSAIVAMAHSLDIKVVAEGIENNEQLDFLRTLQCEEGQGYLFSRPAPAEAIGKRLAGGRLLAPL